MTVFGTSRTLQCARDDGSRQSVAAGEQRRHIDVSVWLLGPVSRWWLSWVAACAAMTKREVLGFPRIKCPGSTQPTIAANNVARWMTREAGGGEIWYGDDYMLSRVLRFGF